MPFELARYTNPSDVLIDTVYALKAGYRQNAGWVMNRKVQAAIRKLKDADGNYLWQPPAAAGGRASLMGFPLVEAEEMPDAAANATLVAFGDFSRGYLVVDRMGVRVLRDPYSAKPYVLFYTTKRVGGGIQDFEAIKLLKYGTTEIRLKIPLRRPSGGVCCASGAHGRMSVALRFSQTPPADSPQRFLKRISSETPRVPDPAASAGFRCFRMDARCALLPANIAGQLGAPALETNSS